VLIISNASVKNNVAISILHIYRGQEIIAKLVYYAINITFTKAELFVIRWGINYIIYLQNIEYIVVIIDTISAAKWIFDTSMHLYQLYSIAISKDLRSFFNNNLIDFWDCPESVK